MLRRLGPQLPGRAAQLAGLRPADVSRVVASGAVTRVSPAGAAPFCVVCGAASRFDHLCHDCRTRLCAPLVTGQQGARDGGGDTGAAPPDTRDGGGMRGR